MSIKSFWRPELSFSAVVSVEPHPFDMLDNQWWFASTINALPPSPWTDEVATCSAGSSSKAGDELGTAGFDTSCRSNSSSNVSGVRLNLQMLTWLDRLGLSQRHEPTDSTPQLSRFCFSRHHWKMIPCTCCCTMTQKPHIEASSCCLAVLNPCNSGIYLSVKCESLPFTVSRYRHIVCDLQTSNTPAVTSTAQLSR